MIRGSRPSSRSVLSRLAAPLSYLTLSIPAQQMRLIHSQPFSPQEIESYRQLVFNNLTQGMKYLLESMEDMELMVTERNEHCIPYIMDARDIRDQEPYPQDYLEPLQTLWADDGVKAAWARANEAALPEKYSFSLPYVN